MGSYAQCWLDNLYVGSSKNDVDPNLITLFRSSDKVIIAPPVVELPFCLEQYRESLEEDDETRLVFYETSTEVARDRLELLGYTIDAAKEAFKEWIKKEQQNLQDSIDMVHGYKMPQEVRNSYQIEHELLSGLTPEKWIDAITLINKEAIEQNHSKHIPITKDTSIEEYMLSRDWYGFPGHDCFVPIRLALEACPNGRKLIYDVSDVILSGYFEYSHDFVEEGMSYFAGEYSSFARTVVLTEGRTDAWILRESLRVLYPHLQDYFSFMDFDNSNFGGGVGSLVNVVKAFAGAGIVNNIVALFDNDTAAADAVRVLSELKLPANIVVRHLPQSEFLKSYPTIGPAGPALVDINGVAASIEHYLGEDVLKLPDRGLTPVQWTGYVRHLNKYQGEIMDKAILHDRFRVKLSSCADARGKEWDAMRSVLQTVFTAFRDRNYAAICSYPNEYE